MPSGKFKDYFMLARIDNQGSVGLPFTSALVALKITEVSPRFDILLYFTALLITTLFYNTFGFVLNDYADVETDRLGKHLSEKPLVKGTISKRSALAFAGSSAMAATLFAGLITNSAPVPLAVFGVSIIFVTIYDLFGKKFAGSDVFLAGAISTFCLFSALSVSPAITLVNIPPLVYVICLLVFIQVFYNDTVHGGVKDADHDHLSGTRTIAVVLGVRVEDHNLRMPKSFVVYGLTIKVIYATLLLFAVVTFNLNTSYKQIPILLLILPLIIGMFLATGRYLTLDTWDREKLWRIYIINEYCTYSLIPVMSLPIIGIKGVLFLMSMPLMLTLAIRLLVFGRKGIYMMRRYH